MTCGHENSELGDEVRGSLAGDRSNRCDWRHQVDRGARFWRVFIDPGNGVLHWCQRVPCRSVCWRDDGNRGDLAGTMDMALFDGTWNTPDDNGDIDGDQSTNVYKFFDAIEAVNSQGTNQYTRYDKGVGMKWYNKFKGGVFGVGLNEKVQG